MYKLLKRIVISGHPGTGTTTLIDQLAKLYNLKPEQKIKIGDLFRQNAKEITGQDITSFYQRDITEDLSIDNMQKKLLSDPNPELIFILESRLGGFFTGEIREKAKNSGTLPPPIVTVLLTTDEKVRFKRVYQRDKQTNPALNYQQVSEQIKQRQEQDFKQWQQAYPDISQNPLDEVNLYDLHVDNTNLNIDQTVEVVNERLTKMGALEKI